jgi:hypothetical protein
MGAVSGSGADEIGTFFINGSWDVYNGAVSFCKQYHGAHSVDYNGNLTLDGRSMDGRYNVGGHVDTFDMSLAFY